MVILNCAIIVCLNKLIFLPLGECFLAHEVLRRCKTSSFSDILPLWGSYWQTPNQAIRSYTGIYGSTALNWWIMIHQFKHMMVVRARVQGSSVQMPID